MPATSNMPALTIDYLDRWHIDWHGEKPVTFEITAEAFEQIVTDRNKAHEVRRRALNARTMDDGDEVTVNDGLGGRIASCGALLQYLLGREPLEWDQERDEELPFEEWPDKAVDA